MREALRTVVERTDSRVTGSRFARLLDASKKNKSHAMAVLASSYGACDCMQRQRQQQIIVHAISHVFAWQSVACTCR